MKHDCGWVGWTLPLLNWMPMVLLTVWLYSNWDMTTSMQHKAQPANKGRQTGNKQTKKKAEINKKKCGSMTKKRQDRLWNKLNHFHRWNHVKRGVRRYQKMFFFYFFVDEAFRWWWPPTKSRQIEGNWQWCPREAKPRLRGHHCLDR